uniref:DUF4283 domain-containing protein n=1 Tax=Solanum tuberosum TaxID=4113 RepID=M1DHQ1_SOLTU
MLPKVPKIVISHSPLLSLSLRSVPATRGKKSPSNLPPTTFHLSPPILISRIQTTLKIWLFPFPRVLYLQKRITNLPFLPLPSPILRLPPLSHLGGTSLELEIAKTTKIDLIVPSRSTKQGRSTVMYDINDYMVTMSDSCIYTLIGKFYDPMPKMEVIRKNFITQVELSSSVRITHFNSRHIYIDLDNELYRATVLDSKRLYIEGKFMRIHVWTPTLSPNLETPIVPFWVLLLELPWHYYYKEFVTHLLADVGKVIHLDAAFLQKTRGSFAKVKVQMDITLPRKQSDWIGFDSNNDINGEGRWQDIECEDIPLYCVYCKHQGHALPACELNKRDEERKKYKEKEKAGKKAKHPLDSPLELTGNSGMVSTSSPIVVVSTNL